MSEDKPSGPSRAASRVPLPPSRKRDEEEASAADELQIDDLIDARYRVKGSIGEGGVGRVYRALQVKLGRDVAVKVLQDLEMGDPNQRPRFEREAMALAALNHPNIVSVQDYGIWRERPFLVMEMLEGESLRDRLDRGPIAEREALRITRSLLHALAYAHSKGIVHRDLKPANVFLQAFPTQLDHVKILDFGFAKFVDHNALADAPALTQAGTTMGTPAYVAPERLYGSAVDGRSDLYSVGILLFEMLCGKKPFDGDISEILRAHLADPVPRLADRRDGLGQSEALTALFERALAKPVEERFADAAAMLAAIDALQLPATWREGPDLATDGAGDEELPTRMMDPDEAAAFRAGLMPAEQHASPGRRRSASQSRAQAVLAEIWEKTLGLAQTVGELVQRGYAWAAPRLRRTAQQWLRDVRARTARLHKGSAAPLPTRATAPTERPPKNATNAQATAATLIATPAARGESSKPAPNASQPRGDGSGPTPVG